MCKCLHFQADIIIWDFNRRSMYAKLTLHMVKVEALAFSPNELYLASLGGADDGRYGMTLSGMPDCLVTLTSISPMHNIFV